MLRAGSSELENISGAVDMDTYAAVLLDSAGCCFCQRYRGVTAVRVARRSDRCGGGYRLSANQTAAKVFAKKRAVGVPLLSPAERVALAGQPSRQPEAATSPGSTGLGWFHPTCISASAVISMRTISLPGRWSPASKRSSASPDELSGSPEVPAAVEQVVSSSTPPAAPSLTSPAAAAPSLCSCSCFYSSSSSGSSSSPQGSMPTLCVSRIPNESRSEGSAG